MISETDKAAQLARIRAREAERTAERERDTQAIEAEAAAYAVDHDLITDDPPGHVTALRHWELLGGLRDPVTASYAAEQFVRSGGVRVTTYEEMAAQQESARVFWDEHGGGRFPGQQSPQPPEPPRPARLPAAWLDDPDCHYDAESLAKIRAAREARPQ